MENRNPPATLTLVTTELLRDWALPMPDKEGDKEERGRVLIIGGSRELAGAVILAGIAALRAGAGKLAIATVAGAAPHVAAAIPEARVVSLPETEKGGIAPEAAEQIENLAQRADAVLIGPGMDDEPAICAFLQALLPRLNGRNLILDAGAMCIAQDAQAFCRLAHEQDEGKADTEPRLLFTPHAGEMARLSGRDKDEVANEPERFALEAAQRLRAVVALKGKVTHIATPHQQLWRHEGGNVGLATSGSGDVLAGLICGLTARGAPLAQACVWGVALHARAGEMLAARMGTLGYLARELAPEVPGLMAALAAGTAQEGGGSGEPAGPDVTDAAAA